MAAHTPDGGAAAVSDIPSLDRLLNAPAMHAALDEHGRTQVVAALRRDLEKPDSTLGQHLERSLQALGESLVRDPSLRDALNTHLTSAAESLTARLRSGVTEHIAQTMKGWDERQLVDVLELAVGRDLQYIRFNGTLVGGLIGVVLHAVVVLTGV